MYKILCAIFFAPFFIHAHKADCIVFSYNRPLQLYAFLESVEKYVADIGDVVVIYRASNKSYVQAYEEVQQAYPRVHFVCQNNAAHKADFKPLVLQCLEQSTAEYCLFGVDDSMVKDYFSCAQCIELIEREGAYAFYLRLGRHVDSSYPDVCHPLPASLQEKDGYLMWNFIDGTCNWNCIHNLDLTLYRKEKVLNDFRDLVFSCPNSLEGEWGTSRYLPAADARGICFYDSKMVNIPLNQVQECCYVPNMNYLNARELLVLFNRGMKLALEPLYKINNRSPHIDHIPQFIPRK